ncbi:GT2 family glycosyltransferase [Janthinobacterium sp. CG_23.3]|uniref:glycosyltransferase family 2 protein n=1 Tax=Janthinobacterium sp. CG_23.3 TaxID=3349634 RepID=UPI0038D3CF1E
MNINNKAGDMPKIWIVLVNWNGWRDTVECLESVLRLDYPHFRVVVCDNDSSDGSVASLQAWASGAEPGPERVGPLAYLSSPALPKPVTCAVVDTPAHYRADADVDGPLLIARTGGNLGFAGGNNVGIRMALSDPACQFVWLLNNDTVVDPACLARMVETAKADVGIGITGSVNCFYAEPDVVQALGGGLFSRGRAFADLHGHCLRRGDITAAVRQRTEARLDWISGASMLVSRDFLNRVGEMEERYFLYYEEIDWALRSEKLFRNAVAYSALVYHKSGSSTGAQVDSGFSIYTQFRSRFKLYRKLLPVLLPLCYLKTVKDWLFATFRGQRVRANAILRASRDELFSS